MIIYPERIAFTAFYYVGVIKIDKLFLKKFIESLSVTLIIGLPIIFIKTIYLCFTEDSLQTVWYKLSKYKNIKLIFKDGNIIRNMSPSKFDSFDVIGKNIVRGIMITGRCNHAVAFDKNIGIGFTCSMSGMKGRGCDLIDKYPCGTKSLMQKYEIGKVIVSNNITNENLAYVLDRYSTSSVLKSQLKFLKSDNIIYNDGSSQKLIDINPYMKYEMNNYLETIGGINNVNNYLIGLNETMEMIFKLRVNMYSNDSFERNKIYVQLKHISDRNIFPDLKTEIDHLLSVYDLLYK